MGEVHALRIKSPYKLLHVEDIKITNKPNEHGRLYLKCLIDDSINFKYSIEASTKDEITVYEENESDNNSEADINKVDESRSKVIFNGLIESIKTTNENGIYYLEIEGISKTSILDVEKKSRSFQNLNMTYEELIALILKHYGDVGFIQNVGCGVKLKGPIFQYNETDWELLLRICRELNGVLYCDIINLNNLFYFGISEGKTYEIKDDIPYKACKDLKAFYKAGGYDEGYHDTDYFYYEISTREQYDLGDKIYFKQKDVYVTEYAACKYQDEIIYKYRLCRKNGVWFTKLYNSLICGASLEGKVLATRGEEVKLHLNIDKEQNEDEAAWFKYAPPTGNVMYSMPIVGTSARLYFPDETGREPLVSGCVRNNGSSCAKTSDTTKRYFGTEHGSEVEMTPSALNIKGGSASPISISIDDNKGITITSPKKLTLNADSEIIMKTPKSVKINGVSQINAQKTNTESGFSLETDLHFLSDNVIKNGSSSESYPDYDDEPEEGQMPEPPAKKGFNWGGLLVAAVAVVASVVTFGIGAVLIGAAIGAAISVVSTAIGDAISGKRSSLGTYIKNALVGAVSGAIFGPFGAFESLGGMMAFGGLSGMGESLLNQAIEGKFSLGQTLFDGLIGAASAGLLHGAGKLISKVSPYIKNGIGKVLGKLSGGAKNILSKVSGKLDDVLGAFSKTSRELFDKVANKVGNVFRNIKNSAQDLADRLSGKFNEITSKIDDKIDDALRSISGKADDALNAANEWTDRVGYNIKKSLGLQEEYAGIGDMYIPPDKSNFFKDKVNKIISNKNGGSVGNVEFNQHNSNEITEADRIKQFNLNNCRNQMKNDLNKLRKELVDTQDISKICSTVDVGDLNLKGEAGSGIWTYNPTIKDYRGIDPREFCETSEDYTKYYRSLLTDEYLDSLPDNFWQGKNKEFIKEDMSKLRADIERVKREAAELGKFNQYGEPSFEKYWNIDNCAEIWSSRDAILKGARYDDLVYRTENIRGGFAEPCKNCQRTFIGRYVISD